MNEGTRCEGWPTHPYADGKVSCGSYHTSNGLRRLCGSCYDLWRADRAEKAELAAIDAIRDSVRYNTVTWTDDAPGAHAHLERVSEGSVECNNHVAEYWGTSTDGHCWRVHILRLDPDTVEVAS